MSLTPHPLVPPVATEPLARRLARVRSTSLELCRGLSAEDCAIQSMPDASPVKWHLAHTTWFFETLVLEPELPGYRSFHPQFRMLFNSYYNSVGEQYPRPERGLLSRPSLEEVRGYREHVESSLFDALERGLLPEASLNVVEIGLHHEQQHQELIVTDVKHMLSCNPLRPALAPEAPRPPSADPGPLRWCRHAGGVHEIGHRGRGFAFDNERPRHQTFVAGFEIASRPVLNREWLAFIEDGGYRTPELWLSDGWTTVQERGWEAPLYWKRNGENGEGWSQLTAGGERPLEPGEPTCHVSYFEADAFARWAGVRLPSEAEWEHAFRGLPVQGNFLESGYLHPAAWAETSQLPVAAFGDVWEWTRSPYGPYPGFRPLAGSLAEYNGKFMCSQLVLRGGSCVTPASHMRPTYRNFFYPDARWQLSGVRLARDLAA